MHHLLQRVDASVGAPGGENGDAFARNAAQRQLQRILDVGDIGLTLPAVVAATVVLHSKRNPHRHPPSSMTAIAATSRASTTLKACSFNSMCCAPVDAGCKAALMVARQSLAVSRMAVSAYCNVKARRTAMRSRDRPSQRNG